MKPHKWAKEIKAWADGAEIEWKCTHEKSNFAWHNSDVVAEDFDQEDLQFRIKPQPKEPQYLYVYGVGDQVKLSVASPMGMPAAWVYIGKIKLEQDE